MQKFSKTSDGKKGGLFVGKKHSEGGIPAVVVDTGQPIEVEGGEAIINAKATALHWKELSKINQSTGGVPIPKPSDAEKLLEKFENGGKLTIKDKQTIYQKWKSLVNMSYSELEKYYNSKEGKESGLSKSEADSQGISSGRESARWIMRMKKTNYKNWTPEMWRWANKQISFISRMRGNQGDLYDEKGKKTRKLMSLLIWGHNPKKFNVGGKTIAQTPAPKKERISGSSTNKPETSSSIGSAKQIEFSESTITKIRNIVREHNKKHPSKKINLSSAKAVVRRGMGAYSSSHRPTISGGKPNSRVAWGLARLNAFTYKIINGKSKSGKYNQDDDLINELGLKVQKYDGGGLVAPNGKPSNLTPEQYKIVRTPAFKKWFGDWENDPANASKVVDENGEPMVVYHGTTSEFNVFKIADKFREDWGVRDYGAYFTNNKKTAEFYSLDFEKKKKDYLHFEQELERLEREENWQEWKKKYNERKEKFGLFDLEKQFESIKIYECFLSLKNPLIIDGDGQIWFKVLKGVVDKALNSNNDGIIVKDIIEQGKDVQTTFAAFKPNQIKLADRTNTTFDNNNPDIRFMAGGQINFNNMDSTKQLLQAINLITEKSYFQYDGEDGGVHEFSTRENGDVGNETPGKQDVAEAYKLKKMLDQQFDKVMTEVEIVDEWVMLFLSEKLGSNSVETEKQNKEKQNKENAKKLYKEQIINQLGYSKEKAEKVVEILSDHPKRYYEKNKDRKDNYNNAFRVLYTKLFHIHNQIDLANAKEVFDYITNPDFAKNIYSKANPDIEVVISLYGDDSVRIKYAKNGQTGFLSIHPFLTANIENIRDLNNNVNKGISEFIKCYEIVVLEKFGNETKTTDKKTALTTKPKMKKTNPEFTDKAKKLVPKNQLSALQEIKYREQDEAVANVNENVSLVPDLYGQDGKGKEAVAYLHYFLGGSDWYITEYNEEEYTAYGFVVLNQDWQMAEFGYISMQELTKSMPLNRPSIELDFYWEPATINEIIDKNEPKYNTDEESEIDFLFNPPNQNGIKLLNQLTQFPVEISDQDANFFVLKNSKIGIQFFDNTTEFKFDIFTTSELHKDLQNALRQIDPIASTRGGKLRSYHDIAMDMIELLSDITEVYDSMIINEPGAKIPIKLIELRLDDSTYFNLKSLSEADAKMRELLDTQSFSDLRYSIEWQDGEGYGGTIDCEPRSFFENVKNPFSRHIKTWITNVATKGKDFPGMVEPMDIVFYQSLLTKYEIEPNIETMLDINSYKNPYELNKAIESFLDTKVGDFENSKMVEFTPEEKLFIKNYTGFGGLGKYGELTVGSMFEFFTPKKVIEKMWALAYKYGYSADKSILETSVGTGEFLQFANPLSRVKAFEINKYSAIITQILYPFCDVNLMPFESNFIKNRDTIKDKIDNLEKFDLIIGNPPYGDFSILDDKATQYLLGFGEQKFTQAKNYVEYFLRRSVDLLNSQGLIVMIIGAEVRGGGTLFLDSGNSPVKEYLAEKCELLDAYRLPDTTFERTGVTSDIIVLRKK